MKVSMELVEGIVIALVVEFCPFCGASWVEVAEMVMIRMSITEQVM